MLVPEGYLGTVQLVKSLQPPVLMNVALLCFHHYGLPTENEPVCFVSSSTFLGDGTMLLVASKVFDKNKPIIGVNTDPER